MTQIEGHHEVRDSRTSFAEVMQSASSEIIQKISARARNLRDSISPFVSNPFTHYWIIQIKGYASMSL
jgi:hypothetical protein